MTHTILPEQVAKVTVEQGQTASFVLLRTDMTYRPLTTDYARELARQLDAAADSAERANIRLQRRTAPGAPQFEEAI